MTHKYSPENIYPIRRIAYHYGSHNNVAIYEECSQQILCYNLFINDKTLTIYWVHSNEGKTFAVLLNKIKNSFCVLKLVWKTFAVY